MDRFTSQKNAEIDAIGTDIREAATKKANDKAAEAAAANEAERMRKEEEAERRRKKEKAKINEGTKKDFIRHAKKIENIIRKTIKDYEMKKYEIEKTKITLKSRYKADTYDKNLEKAKYLELEAELNEKIKIFNADVKKLDEGDYHSLSFYKSLVEEQTNSTDDTMTDSDKFPASSAAPDYPSAHASPASSASDDYDAPTSGSLGGGKYRKKSRKKKNTSNKKIKKKVKSRKI